MSNRLSSCHHLRVIWAVLAGLACLLLGCESEPVRARWLLRFEPPALRDRAVHVDARIVAGGCESGGDVVYRTSREPEGTVAPPLIEAGRWGFGAGAVDAECRVYAAGCDDYTLPPESGQDIVVTLTEVADAAPACGVGERCDRGECVPDAGDAGPDDAGGTPDAGPRDGGPPDAGPSDPTICDEVDSLFCADFEGSNVLEGWSFEIDDSTGAVERTEVPVFRGAGAMHAYVTVAGASARAGVNITPVASGNLHLRFYAFVPAAVALQETAVITLNNATPPYYQIGLILSADNPLVFASQTGDAWRGPVAFPRDRWVCVEMEVGVSETDGRVVVRVDGDPQIGVMTADTLPGTGIEQLTAGVQGYGMQTEPTEIYLDEIVLSDALVACD